MGAEDNTQYELCPLPQIAYNLAAYRAAVDFRTWGKCEGSAISQ